MLNSQVKPLLIIKPKELVYQPPFVGVISNNLILQNSSDHSLAYKVKTTAPIRYCVRPNTGIIPPGSSVEILVLLNCSKEMPSFTMKTKDKFQIQSLIVTDDKIDPKELWSKSPPSQVMKQKLKAVFSVPNVSSSNHHHHHSSSHSHQSQSPTQSQSQSDPSTYSNAVSSFSSHTPSNDESNISTPSTNSSSFNQNSNIPDSIIINKQNHQENKLKEQEKEKEKEKENENDNINTNNSNIKKTNSLSSSSVSNSAINESTSSLKKRIVKGDQTQSQDSPTSSAFIHNSNNNIGELQTQIKKLTENIEKLEQEKKDLKSLITSQKSSNTTISQTSQLQTLLITFIIAIISFFFGKLL